MTQAIHLAKRPHIVVGTPGRVVYHLENTKGFSLRSLQYLVLDEADRLLNLDFEKEINTILKVIPKERHTYLFSATMTTKVQKLQRASLRDPVKLEVSAKYTTPSTLLQQFLFIPAKFKDVYLVYMLNELAGAPSNRHCIIRAISTHTTRTTHTHNRRHALTEDRQHDYGIHKHVPIGDAVLCDSTQPGLPRGAPARPDDAAEALGVAQ